MKNGFSLVELSIVLVILGLLTGGILAGQSLIRAAELRSVSTEYSRYVTATQTFRDKYFALPGDMRNATAFWGKDNAACTGDTGTTATPGTCNGNGDNVFAWAAVAGGTGEVMQSWKQLALAGLVEGSFTGLSTTCTFCVTVGTTVPASRLGNAGWTMSGVGVTVPPAHPQWFEGTYSSTVLFLGRQGNYTSERALKAEEAWNIDTKMDDGQPARGRVRSWNNSFHSTCTNTDALTATYTLSGTDVACALVFDT